MRRPLLLAAIASLSLGCRADKYAQFHPPAGDFSCEVPRGWSVYEDRQSSGYVAWTFAGPFDPDFYLGVPTLSVRWYAFGRPHVFRDGSSETYSSAESFIDETLRDVYGPKAVLLQPKHKVMAAGRPALHVAVLSPVEAPAIHNYGVLRDAEGRRIIARQHECVVIPTARGFYAIVYPATREGHGRYVDRFNRLVNTFALIKEGPDGEPVSSPRASKN